MTLRNLYQEQLDVLLNDLDAMGFKVSNIMQKTIVSLRNLDFELAHKISSSDYEIDKIDHDIENKCIRLLSLQHPVASDLRKITGYLKIITDIERISDQCADICEIIWLKNLNSDTKYLDLIISMLTKVYDMFKRILKIVKLYNLEECKDICEFDNEVDSDFTNIISNICSFISIHSDKTEFTKSEYIQSNTKISSKVKASVDLLFIAKYIERIGDHCTNIAEWVIYIHTGVHLNLN
ncbi:MAG: phosphate signaling complex protein PhoU [Candidatus Improbicoccus devescovinae]|nr:MAG: phosphate signaling complex protein PhoU [Candidatus Improbicoccus devescovinae]